MATEKALNGKAYAGNPHVRFDEGEVASTATPRRGSLLYNKTVHDITNAHKKLVPMVTLSCLLLFAVKGGAEVVYENDFSVRTSKAAIPYEEKSSLLFLSRIGHEDELSDEENRLYAKIADVRPMPFRIELKVLGSKECVEKQ